MRIENQWMDPCQWMQSLVGSSQRYQEAVCDTGEPAYINIRELPVFLARQKNPYSGGVGTSALRRPSNRVQRSVNSNISHFNVCRAGSIVPGTALLN